MNDQPAEPGLEYAFTITATIGAPLTGADSPLGDRLHIPITGGTVEGPALAGIVMPGGSDWPLLRRDGNSRISARYTIMADDGTPIMVENDGLRVSSAEVTARLRAGEPVDASEYYFRTTPIFEAPDGPHQWLNEAVFVASLARAGDEILVAVYRVT
jgi:hypothetical protein